ncbi:hypothetical protein EDB83DRAFT_2317467 [Lactarius deliciosus]|nr:hypothetical protein EDB83DRAFT_2317467 [Lactarius deliciosus]
MRSIDGSSLRTLVSGGRGNSSAHTHVRRGHSGTDGGGEREYGSGVSKQVAGLGPGVQKAGVTVAQVGRRRHSEGDRGESLSCDREDGFGRADREGQGAEVSKSEREHRRRRGRVRKG